MTFRRPLVAAALVSIAALPLAAAQDPPAASGSPLRYEVASIKPCAAEPQPPGAPGGRAAGSGNATTSPGRAHWECVTLDGLLQTAYGPLDNRLLNSFPRQLPGEPKLVRGGPSWVYSEKFAIDAKAATAADRATLIGPMLRALLEDRFKLKTHRATEERSMYEVTVAKGGLKIKPTAPGECRVHEPGAPADPSPDPAIKSCGNLHMTWNGGNRRLEFTGEDIQNFGPGFLSGMLQKYVLDGTGLQGRYNIAFEFAPDDDTPGNVAALAWARRDGAEPPTAPPIFTALEQQIGLKVSRTKAPAEYLVIDSVERPSLDAAVRQPPHQGSAAVIPGVDRRGAGAMAVATGMMLAISASLAASILAKVTLTTLVALVAVRVSRRSPAAVRHLVLLAAFAVLLVLPMASILTPPVSIPVAAAAPPQTAPAAADTSTPLVVDQAGETGAAARGGSSSPAASASAALMVVWTIGIALFLLPVAVALWLIASLRRSALPWADGQSVANHVARDLDVGRRVEVLLHESLPGPMTCGLFRPAIVLPIDAQRWSEEDVRRAIVHELEHVRRRDWITQAIARVVCACYWFHPLVWIACRQLALEAERACDDAVLKRSDATAYADQLVGLARRLSASTKSTVLAMANRHDLSARVIAVLDHRQPRGRVDTVSLVLACAASALIVLAIAPITIIAGVASAPQTAAPKFDVASIRPCVSDTPTAPGARSSQGGFPNISPGRFTFDCGTVERLISTAYVQNGESLLNQAARIGDVAWAKGIPGWVRSDKFTIEARAQGTPDRKEMLGPMLRALLEDRFKLKLHRDTEEVAQYVMTVAKGGLKIKPIGPDGCTTFDPDDRPSLKAMADPNAKPICGNMMMLRNGPLTKWTLGGDTMEGFAGTLSAFMDRHVIDKTGITDTFNIRLEFVPDEHVPGPDKRYGPLAPADAPQADGPNIFKALEEQLGLKLDTTKGPHGFLVIDHVEKPAADGPMVHFVPPARAAGPGRRGR